MIALEFLVAILGLSVLVIVHESGHYLVARAFKMRVLRYSIGFGPTLFRYQPKGSPTVFQIGAIPFLAYVQIAGMNPHEDVDPTDPEIYPNKSLFARAATMAAGPGANYLAAVVIAFFLALHGWPSATTDPMTVGALTPDFPAARAGLEEGDVFVEANGKPIGGVADLIEVTSSRTGQPTEYVVERDGRRLDPIMITPADKDGRGVIGVEALLHRAYKAMPLGAAARHAVMFPLEFTAFQIAALPTISLSQLKGPVGMTDAIVKSVQRGPPDFVRLLILLSVALGFFNLLPFPALDGGRLLFLGYELVTRRRANERFETVVHTVGIVFLLGVLVLVTYRDILDAIS